jgi:hypothetical protein
MPNKWIEHVKAFASKNNLSYGCAISKPECKSSYQKAPKPPSKSRKMKSSSMVGINPTEVYSSPPRAVISTPTFATQPSKLPKPQKGAKASKKNPKIKPITLFPKKKKLIIEGSP